jgi:mono/diheme cytochrome c family protein
MKILMIVILLLLAGACEGPERYSARQPSSGFFEDAGNRQAGRALFQRHCSVCHGRLEEGRSPTASSFTPPPSDFSHPRYRSIDPGYLYWRIRDGKLAEPYRSRGSMMPAWGPHLSEDEIWQLVAYVRTRPASQR